MSDFDVDSEELRTHATNLKTLQPSIVVIQDAINQITEDTGAYGLICQFLPPILSGRQTAQHEVVGSLSTNIGLLADALNTTADDYDASDADADEEIRLVGADLETGYVHG